MSERRAKGCLVAAVVWCVILAALGAGYKFLVHPYLSKKLRSETGSSSQYKHEVTVAADSFSGYCILRSPALREALKAQQIRLTVRDDKADYPARLQALKEGQVQMAAFTIDSLLLAGAKAGDIPGTIVLVLDETKGGDAIVADQTVFPSLQQLDDPEVRLVLTPNSPSEFLARVVIAHFNLPRLPEKWWEEADGARDVYQKLRRAGAGAKRAYVLWEPYVSKALENPSVRVLLDSSKLKGYIVDVLVARREFLRDEPEVVRAVVEGYLRAAYAYAQSGDGMAKLVREDAEALGAEKLDAKQAAAVVAGVQWKNTLENYAHFGLSGGPGVSGVPLLEDMIRNIVDVLLKTRAVAADPLQGRHEELFYNKILAQMRSGGFHPGRGLNLIPGLDTGTPEEKVRTDGQLAALPPEQWEQLREVGQLRVEPINFVRGSARLSVESERDLRELAGRLQSYSRYYLRVTGHTRAEGDAEANRQLALGRAEAAAVFLAGEGVARERMRTVASPAELRGGEAQAVTFEVLQMPY